MKKIKLLFTASVLGFSSLLAMIVPGAAFAVAPYTCTWTGGGGNSNFSTAGNWSGCNSAAPQAGDGDNLVFNYATLSGNTTANNNISNLTAGTITFQGTSTNSYTLTLTGNAVSVASGIANTSTASPTIDLGLTLSASQSFTGGGLFLGDRNTSPTLNLNGYNLTFGTGSDTPFVYLYDMITGTGNISVLNGAAINIQNANSGWTGNTSIASGAQVYSYAGAAFGTSSSSITVVGGGLLAFCGVNGATVSQAITAGGTGANNSGAITSDVACNTSSSNPNSYANVTFSGAITLTANTTVGSAGVMTITGPLSGSFTITPAAGIAGSLVINSSNNTSLTPNGSHSAPVTTTTYSNNSPSTTIDILNNATGIVDGTYGDTTVQAGGTLKGNGTVGALYVLKGGIVAPGHSPGCLTATGNLQEVGTYQAELGGTTACTGYDQIIVNGTVTLDDSAVPPTQGTLQLSLVNGFKPAAGQTFEIINNKGTGAVTDTFASMPEGATFTVSGYVFKITYKGGDGNDVVLTVISVPSTPDTGFMLVKNNPILAMLAIFGAAGGIALIARSKKFATVRARK